MREPRAVIPEVQLPDLDLPYEDGEPLESDRPTGEEDAEAERQARLETEQRVQALEAELARLRGRRGRSPR